MVPFLPRFTSSTKAIVRLKSPHNGFESRCPYMTE
jgi:hypothetical protein